MASVGVVRLLTLEVPDVVHDLVLALPRRLRVTQRKTALIAVIVSVSVSGEVYEYVAIPAGFRLLDGTT